MGITFFIYILIPIIQTSSTCSKSPRQSFKLFIKSFFNMAHIKDDFVKATPRFEEEEYEHNSSFNTAPLVIPPSPKPSIFNF